MLFIIITLFKDAPSNKQYTNSSFANKISIEQTKGRSGVVDIIKFDFDFT